MSLTQQLQIVGGLIPQSDWNQSDTTKHDYIKNKPTDLGDFTNDAGYLTSQDISGKQDVIDDLSTIRSGAALGATSIQDISGKADVNHSHSEYVTTTALSEGLTTKANTSHTHSEYATSEALTTGLDSKASTSHTHNDYALFSDLTNGLNSKANASHSHNDIYYTETEVDGMISNVTAVAQGKTKTYIFDTEDELNTWLEDTTNKSQLKDGDVFLIRAVDVPDYWWDNTREQKYKLETTKVDLTGYATTADVNTALSGKSDTSHTHSGYATTSALTSGLAGKSDTGHTHTEYAASSHTHSAYATTTALSDGLATKANTSHTHDDYATTAALNNKANKSELPTNPLTMSTKNNYDFNTLYNGKISLIANGTNGPRNGYLKYGTLLTMPYRTPSSNTSPDFCAQIFFPTGDYSSDSNSMFYRTSLSTSWNPWQQVATTSDLSTGLATKANTSHTHSDYATNTALTDGLALKANTSDLATVATSGKYSDLSETPSSLPANGGNADTVDSYHIWCGSSSSLPATRNSNTIYIVL